MKKFLTFQDAAEYLGIPEAEFQAMVDQGNIPAYKVGGVYTRFKTDDLNLYSRKFAKKIGQNYSDRIIGRIKDFFYFNDFYLFSAIVIIVILYFIFR